MALDLDKRRIVFFARGVCWLLNLVQDERTSFTSTATALLMNGIDIYVFIHCAWSMMEPLRCLLKAALGAPSDVRRDALLDALPPILEGGM